MGQSLSDSVHNSQPLKREGRQPGWNQGPSAYQHSGLCWAKTTHVLAAGGGGGGVAGEVAGGVCFWGETRYLKI